MLIITPNPQSAQISRILNLSKGLIDVLTFSSIYKCHYLINNENNGRFPILDENGDFLKLPLILIDYYNSIFEISVERSYVNSKHFNKRKDFFISVSDIFSC